VELTCISIGHVFIFLARLYNVHVSTDEDDAYLKRMGGRRDARPVGDVIKVRRSEPQAASQEMINRRAANQQMIDLRAANQAANQQMTDLRAAQEAAKPKVDPRMVPITPELAKIEIPILPEEDLYTRHGRGAYVFHGRGSPLTYGMPLEVITPRHLTQSEWSLPTPAGLDAPNAVNPRTPWVDLYTKGGTPSNPVFARTPMSIWIDKQSKKNDRVKTDSTDPLLAITGGGDFDS